MHDIPHHIDRGSEVRSSRNRGRERNQNRRPIIKSCSPTRQNMKNHDNNDKDNNDDKSIYTSTTSNLPTRQSYCERCNNQRVSSSRHRSKSRSCQQDLNENSGNTTNLRRRRRHCKSHSPRPPASSSPRKSTTTTAAVIKRNKTGKKKNRPSRNYISSGGSLSPSSRNSTSSDDESIIPERLSTVLCRSKRGTPSGGLEKLALKILCADQDDNNNSILALNDSTVIKSGPLLSDPNRIPLNLHW